MQGADIVSAFTQGARIPVHALARALDLPNELVTSIPEGAVTGGPERLVTPRAGKISVETPADMEMLMAGLRPAILLHAPEHLIAGYCDWATRRGLTALPSAWAFRPKADPALGGYANITCSRQPAQDSGDAWRALAVSSSPALAGLLWLAEARGWDETMGIALGYPACCTKAFLRDWPEALRSHGGDPGLMRLNPGGADIPWELNVFARFTGPVLTEHFPCCWDCEASILRARRIAAGLARLAPALATAIEGRMRRDITLGPSGWIAGAITDRARVRITISFAERMA